MADELTFTPIRELSSLVRDGSVSPVELTEMCLTRLDELGPAYNSLVTLTSERALETARRVESELAAERLACTISQASIWIRDLRLGCGHVALPRQHQGFRHGSRSPRTWTVLSSL